MRLSHISKVTHSWFRLWSVSRAASKAGSGHGDRSVCGSGLVSVPLCTSCCSPGSPIEAVCVHTALGGGMREPHDVILPSRRNRPCWKLASLRPRLSYKLISASPSPSLSAQQAPHLHSFQETPLLLSSHFPLPSSCLLLAFPPCLPICQEAQKNPLMGGNHQSPFGNQIKWQTVRQTARDRRKIDGK